MKLFHMSIDTVKNDKEDIRCGGPQYLGFDFYMEFENKKDAEKYKGVISELFRKLNKSFIGVRIEERAYMKIWSKAEVENYIINYIDNIEIE